MTNEEALKVVNGPNPYSLLRREGGTLLIVCRYDLIFSESEALKQFDGVSLSQLTLIASNLRDIIKMDSIKNQYLIEV